MKQELYSRRNNLKIMGANIGKNDDGESYILRIFHNSGINIQSADIERAHFVGPLHCDKGRSILVRFFSSKVKMSVFHKRYLFKDKNITIVDDYPEEILARRRLIVPTYFKALEKCPQMKPKLQVDSVILGGKEY